jgi:GntR family transcriptional regulator, histidine utilization repressor
MKLAALHDRIRQDIEARIMSGAWEAGHRVPVEHELMTEYGCSRMTVQKAINALVRQGMLTRNKKAGTFVAAPKVHRAALEIPDIAADIAARGQAHKLGIISRVEREGDQRDYEQLAMRAGKVLAITCLHRADDRPFALEERLINLEEVPQARDAHFAPGGPGSWLLAHVPWTDARHRITAIAAARPVAERLALPVGSPCLAMERWTWRTEQRITYVRLIYPGERYDLAGSFLA